MTSDTPASEIVKALEALSISELDDAGWGSDSLLAVIQEDSASQKSRLYACSILLGRDQEKFLNIIGEQKVAGLYASAIVERTTTDLNSWAFLGMGDMGRMGSQLVASGDSALTALAPLLDVKQSAGIYSGSKESKVGNSDHARICDFAAFFAFRILHLPYSFHRDSIDLRDAEIERLRKILRSRVGSSR